MGNAWAVSAYVKRAISRSLVEYAHLSILWGETQNIMWAFLATN